MKLDELPPLITLKLKLKLGKLISRLLWNFSVLLSVFTNVIFFCNVVAFHKLNILQTIKFYHLIGVNYNSGTV